MKRCLSPFLMAIVIGLVVVGVWTPSKAAAWGCSKNLQRLVAEFNYFDNGEASTSTTVPGIPIYQKMVYVPDGCDTLYVTISAVGDTHDGAANWLACKVDFDFCNPNPTPETGTKGWIAVQRHGILDDFHDNSIYYTWCKAITPGTHAVELRMASSDSDLEVFIEGAHFYVDASYTGGGCALAEVTFPDPPAVHLPPLSLRSSAPTPSSPPVPTPTSPAPGPIVPPLPTPRLP